MVCVGLKQCYNREVKEVENLVIDIRSGSLGASVISSIKGMTEVSFCTRKRTSLEKSFDPRRLIGQVAVELKSFLLDIRSKKPHLRPRSIHLVISSPWFVSQTRSVVHKSNEVVTYSESIIHKLFKEEEEEFRRVNFGDRESQTIERELLAVTLNGYPTDKPYGKKAKEIGLSFYLSMVESEFLDIVRTTIRGVWHSDLVIHTFPFLTLNVLGEELSSMADSYILLDIGGEVSELALVRNTSTIESYSFPLGAHSIIREIGKTFKFSLFEAESMYRAYILGQVDKKIGGQIEQVLEDTKVRWATYLHGMLEKIAMLRILPPTVVIIGSAETSKLLNDVMKDPEITKLFMNQQVANVILPDTHILDGRISIRPGSGIVDIFLAIEVLAIDTLVQNS